MAKRMNDSEQQASNSLLLVGLFRFLSFFLFGFVIYKTDQKIYFYKDTPDAPQKRWKKMSSPDAISNMSVLLNNNPDALLMHRRDILASVPTLCMAYQGKANILFCFLSPDAGSKNVNN